MALDWGVALTAAVAAVFWYLSAQLEVPPPRAYFDQAPPDDPFFTAIRTGARMNQWAASFSAASALCASLRIMVPLVALLVGAGLLVNIPAAAQGSGTNLIFTTGRP